MLTTNLIEIVHENIDVFILQLSEFYQFITGHTLNLTYAHDECCDETQTKLDELLNRTQDLLNRTEYCDDEEKYRYLFEDCQLRCLCIYPQVRIPGTMECEDASCDGISFMDDEVCSGHGRCIGYNRCR